MSALSYYIYKLLSLRHFGFWIWIENGNISNVAVELLYIDIFDITYFSVLKINNLINKKNNQYKLLYLIHKLIHLCNSLV